MACGAHHRFQRTSKEGESTSSDRTAARVGGVLCIIATVAIVASLPFIGSFESADFLTELAANETQVMVGVLVQLAWVFAVMFIPVVFFPFLKPR